MAIEFATDIMAINICQIRIPIVAVTKFFRTNVIVYCIKRTFIPIKSNIIVAVTSTKLKPFGFPNNRFFFDFRIFETLSIYIHIHDCHMHNVIVIYDTDTVVNFSENEIRLRYWKWIKNNGKLYNRFRQIFFWLIGKTISLMVKIVIVEFFFFFFYEIGVKDCSGENKKW